jgi:hypothetical protein
VYVTANTIIPNYQFFIQNLAEQDFEGRQMKGPTSPEISRPAACTPLNAVRLSVRTWFAISSEMAGRIWLKIGGGTQNIWQSVLQGKKSKKTIFRLCVVFFCLFFLFFLLFFQGYV